jgi:citrate lyase beta subunit
VGRRGSRHRHRRVGQSRATDVTRRRSSSRGACACSAPRPRGVAAVDAVYTDFRDVDGLRREARAP